MNDVADMDGIARMIGRTSVRLKGRDGRAWRVIFTGLVDRWSTNDTPQKSRSQQHALHSNPPLTLQNRYLSADSSERTSTGSTCHVDARGRRYKTDEQTNHRISSIGTMSILLAEGYARK